VLQPAGGEPGSRGNRIDGSWSTPRGAARGADQRWWCGALGACGRTVLNRRGVSLPGPSECGNCGPRRPVAWSRTMCARSTASGPRRGCPGPREWGLAGGEPAGKGRTAGQRRTTRCPRLVTAQAHGPARGPGVVLNEQVRSGGPIHPLSKWPRTDVTSTGPRP
jgi:hypothetical protein